VPRRGDLSAVAMTENSGRSSTDWRHHEPSPNVERAVALKHLNQVDLARRWRVSPRTLERWRWLRQGPAYLKVGNHVVYRIEDIESYEAEQRRTSAAA
jgi:hypothetical protein